MGYSHLHGLHGFGRDGTAPLVGWLGLFTIAWGWRGGSKESEEEDDSEDGETETSHDE